ncbi:MAG: 5,6-dimethylbenzimidazole synthase [Jatrophihabitans sp.]|uniref:5,6-dimethylbenzimidazole synthase n=1 Tax=Jatrophihabitans sp. TaxID=1932789 RepID=UPI003F812772
MNYQRPVPLIGDPSSAAERAADPTGWAFDPTTIDALRRVIAARRDVRRYRPDPVPEALLRDVLDAGHHAPSVGHSQPWRFIVVAEQATRDRAALLADRERLRQADLLTPDRRARLLDLQLEGIREAPIGIVVACDRTAPAGGVLGRATFPDTDLWSCACAIQNIWLAARAAGLGLGWVTLFRPDDLADLLGLPDGVSTLGWLCLGWPDERPPTPGLERHGWSRRLPLDTVVLRERWRTDDAPPPPPSHLAGPPPHAVVHARDSGDDLLSSPGSLGVLDRAVDRALAVAPDCADLPAELIIVAADHPVTRHGVSAYPSTVTDDVYRATLAGDAVGATTAREANLAVRAYRARADTPGDLVSTDGLSNADVERLLGEGIVLGRAGTGLVCLGEVGIGNTTVAAALAAKLLDLPPDQVVGLGAGADAAVLGRKLEVVGAALARTRPLNRRDPHVLLAALGGPDIAVLAGVCLGATAAGRPVVLDGLVTSVAGLLAVRAEPAVQAYLIAGQCSRESAHAAVLLELGLEPLLDLRLRAGEGVGAVLAAQLLRTALRLRASAGRIQ